MPGFFYEDDQVTVRTPEEFKLWTSLLPNELGPWTDEQYRLAEALHEWENALNELNHFRQEHAPDEENEGKQPRERERERDTLCGRFESWLMVNSQRRPRSTTNQRTREKPTAHRSSFQRERGWILLASTSHATTRGKQTRTYRFLAQYYPPHAVFPEPLSILRCAFLQGFIL